MPAEGVPDDALVAFSADGSLLALQRGATLDLVDVATGRGFRQLEVGTEAPAGRTGGVDGGRQGGAVGAADEYVSSPPAPSKRAMLGVFRLTLLDPGTAGFTPAGLDAVDGTVPRLLGWRNDGAAVVLNHRPPLTDPVEGPTIMPIDARIVGLRPGGGATDLLDLPAGVYGAELAVDLVRAGRFGGDPPGFFTRLGETLRGLADMLWPPALAVAGVVALVLAYRRLRTPSSRPPAW